MKQEVILKGPKIDKGLPKIFLGDERKKVRDDINVIIHEPMNDLLVKTPSQNFDLKNTLLLNILFGWAGFIVLPLPFFGDSRYSRLSFGKIEKTFMNKRQLRELYSKYLLEIQYIFFDKKYKKDKELNALLKEWFPKYEEIRKEYNQTAKIENEKEFKKAFAKWIKNYEIFLKNILKDITQLQKRNPNLNEKILIQQILIDVQTYAKRKNQDLKYDLDNFRGTEKDKEKFRQEIELINQDLKTMIDNYKDRLSKLN